MLFRIVAAVLFLTLLAFVGGGFAASVELPWKTFSEQAKDGVGATMAGCPAGQEVFVEIFERDGWLYQSFFAPDSNAYILVVFPQGAGMGSMPIAIGVGEVDMKTLGAHGLIPELRWEPFDPAVHRSPCEILFPASARVDDTPYPLA